MNKSGFNFGSNYGKKEALLKINLYDFKKKALLEMLHSVDRGWFFIFFAAIVSDCIIYGKGRKISEDVMIFIGYDLPPSAFILQTNKKKSKCVAF